MSIVSVLATEYKVGGEPQVPGKKDMPDFDSLSDRVIANHTPEPAFAIKTKLDPESPEEDNPYYNKDLTPEQKKELDEFFGKS